MSALRNLSQKIFKIYFSVPLKLANRINKKLPTELMRAVCQNYEEFTPHYTTMMCRPVFANQLVVKNEMSHDIQEKFAIVIQGAPTYNGNFTEHVIDSYRKMFPKAKIILSTWDTVSDDYICKVKQLGAYVVINETPKISGIGNMNYQVLSTLGGINKAEELGCEFVVKTRTDQRIYKSNLCEFMYSLMSQFPSHNLQQNKRIIVLQGSTGCMFLPYYLADFYYCGTVTDMKKLFSVEQNSLNFFNREESVIYEKKVADELPTIYEQLKVVAPQCIIMGAYATKLGEYSLDTVEAYWRFVYDCIIGISVDQIGLYWRKYSSNIFENSWSHSYEFLDDEEQLLTYNWTFENWLGLYTGVLKYKPEYEQYKLRKRIV